MITSAGLTLSRWPYHLTLVGLCYMWKMLGAFHSTKIPVWNFGNSTCPKTRPKPPRVWLQNTKERYWGQQFCQMERDISVRPTEITGPVKEDHLQTWSRIFQKWSVPFDVPPEISGILGWMESAHWIHTTVCCKVGDPVFVLWPCFRPCLVSEDTRFFIDGGLEDNLCTPSKLFNLQYSPPTLEVTDYFLITLTVMVCYWLKEQYHNI